MGDTEMVLCPHCLEMRDCVVVKAGGWIRWICTGCGKEADWRDDDEWEEPCDD